MIGVALGQQLLSDIGMAVAALELGNGVAVPIQSQPFHAAEDGVNRLIGRAFAVRILDPQQKLSAMMFGIEPIEEGRPGAANMQKSGG